MIKNREIPDSERQFNPSSTINEQKEEMLRAIAELKLLIGEVISLLS